MMKNTLFVLFLLALTVSACAEKHYTMRKGDRIALYYKDTVAGEVLFASSGDAYRLHPAREGKNHLWEVSVAAEKEFTYFYVVDGIITLPECAYTEDDDFGSKNCLYQADM